MCHGCLAAIYIRNNNLALLHNPATLLWVVSHTAIGADALNKGQVACYMRDCVNTT